jgi:predicted amidohydrolase
VRWLRTALLHLVPVTGAIADNRRLIEAGVRGAAARGAHYVLTPELALCGYEFDAVIGTAWIEPQPDAWMVAFCGLVKALRVTVFLSHPERDTVTGRLHNSVFAIAPDGRIGGRHRKIHVLTGGAEGWSTGGTDHVAPVECDGLTVGMLVCADAFPPAPAQTLKAKGAQLLISAAAWGPGLHEPNGEWEARSLETGLPLIVCNRGGRDRTLDFTGAESIVAIAGHRVLSARPDRSVILTCDWDQEPLTLLSSEWEVSEISVEDARTV